jgi:phosphoglycolate phosphatase
MQTRISGFLFDLDGTLIDSLEDLTISVNVVRQYFQLEKLTVDTITNYVGDGPGTLIKRVLKGYGEDQIQEGMAVFKKHYWEHCTDHTRPFHGVIPTLEHFRDKPKAVITNKSYQATCEILSRLNLSSYFALVLGGDSTPLPKPDPYPIQKTLSLLNLSLSTTVIVGDGATDIEAGKRAGILTCAATYGLRPKFFLESLSPDFMIDHFAQLQELFQ